MDLLTTNMDTYRGKQGARAEMVVQQPQVTIKKRTKFQGMTQNMRDFAGFDKQPRRSDMAVPAPETIQLNFDNKYVYQMFSKSTEHSFATVETRYVFGEQQSLCIVNMYYVFIAILLTKHIQRGSMY